MKGQDIVPANLEAMTPAERRVEMSLRQAIWHNMVAEDMSVADIAKAMKLSEDAIEARLPMLEHAIERKVSIQRATLRDKQLMDLQKAIEVCNRVIHKKHGVNNNEKFAAMRMLKDLYDRASKLEGLDRHKDRLEVSGPNGSPVMQDRAVMAEVINLRRARDQKTIEVESKQAT